MIKELLTRQKDYLNRFFAMLDCQAAEQLLELMLKCSGGVICTGVGKSGLVAQKVACTMTSTGTKALYLSPVDALHGDLGIVSAKDIVLFFSKSGESRELLQMIPFLRNRGAHLVAIVCAADSPLAKACEDVVVLPCDNELCPYGLVPSTSAAVQMLFGDLLAIALMQQKGFSLEEYACNHPAGKIGKRIAFKVADLMIQGEKLPLCSHHNKVVETLVELSDKRCGCLVVVDELRRLLGIFTDGDLRRALQHRGAQALQAPISEVMTLMPKWIAADRLAWQALELMEGDQQKPVSALPVLDQSQVVVGLIKMHDIIQSGL